jgi:hypothetical protein
MTLLLQSRCSPNIRLAQPAGQIARVTQITADGSFQGVGSSEAHGSNVYMEARCVGQMTALTCALGVSNGVEGISAKIGSSVNSIGLFAGGAVSGNNAQIGTGPSWALNQWLGLALDLVGRTIQFRNVSAVGAWSSPISITGLGSGILCCLQLGTNGINDGWEINFDLPFLGTPPDLTYRRWDGAPLSIPLT